MNSFKDKQFNQNSVKWIQNDMFLAACSSAPRIHLWNLDGAISSKFLYEMEKNTDTASAQANSLEIFKDKKLLVGGCEDCFVRIFDLNSGKIVKKLKC